LAGSAKVFVKKCPALRDESREVVKG